MRPFPPSPFPPGDYSISIPFTGCVELLRQLAGPGTLELEPDFQRGHVWTPQQQQAWLEHVLHGGPSGRVICLSADGWPISRAVPLVLVDGLQRITAVEAYLAGKIEVFGHTVDWWGKPERVTHRFTAVIANLDRAGTLRWYLGLNAGGTPHAAEEITRVIRLLEEATERA